MAVTLSKGGNVSLAKVDPSLKNVKIDRFSDDELLDAMLAHPILINRPVVVTPLGTALCRPSEAVLDILPDRSAPRGTGYGRRNSARLRPSSSKSCS